MTLPDSAIVRAPRVSLLARPAFSEPAHLQVERQGDSTDGERLVEFAERLRTQSHVNTGGRETRAFLRGVTTKSTQSALDHANYSLLIEGVSRRAAHQLQPHTTGFACTELSQRYVDAGDTQFVVPPAILDNDVMESAWLAQMSAALQSYTSLVNDLMTRYAWIADKMQRRKMAREAAAGVLPQSLETKLVITGSARSWRAFILQLGHEQADLELRRLALCVLGVLVPEAPALFDDIETYVANDRHEATRLVTR